MTTATSTHTDPHPTPFQVDDTVTFRPEAGGTRVGVHYTVDSTDRGTDRANGNKQMISLKRTVGGRTGYRLAYVADLIKVQEFDS